MHTLVDIKTRHLTLSDDERILITKKAQALGRVSHGALVCDVVVDVPHRRHRQGRKYSVRITVSERFDNEATGRGLVACSEHEDLFVAVSKAMKVMKRELRRVEERSPEHWSHPPRRVYDEAVKRIGWPSEAVSIASVM